MKFYIQTLDNVKKVWKPSSNTREVTSALHAKAKKILIEYNPTVLIMEEVYFPLYDRKQLAFDFFIPSLRLVIEVQGEQHFKFTPYFHASKQDFIMQKKRDSEKQAWCNINEIDILYLDYCESELEWRKKLGK